LDKKQDKLVDNKYLHPVLVVLLFIAFAIVSFLIILNKNNPSLLKKKLKIGALLITLTSVTGGCQDSIVTCYDPIPSDMFYLDQVSQGNEISVNLKDKDYLSGRIENRNYNRYSFMISGKKDTLVQKDNLNALDGAFDEKTEEFKINLKGDIPSGSYTLKFYSCEKDSISDTKFYRSSFLLNITGKN
jgi:hypothetical protein